MRGEQGDSPENFGDSENQRGFQLSSTAWEYRGPSAEQARAHGVRHSKVTQATIALNAVPEAEASLLLRITYSDIYLHQCVFKKNPLCISQTNSWGSIVRHRWLANLGVGLML